MLENGLTLLRCLGGAEEAAQITQQAAVMVFCQRRPQALGTFGFAGVAGQTAQQHWQRRLHSILHLAAVGTGLLLQRTERLIIQLLL